MCSFGSIDCMMLLSFESMHFFVFLLLQPTTLFFNPLVLKSDELSRCTLHYSVYEKVCSDWCVYENIKIHHERKMLSICILYLLLLFRCVCPLSKYWIACMCYLLAKAFLLSWLPLLFYRCQRGPLRFSIFFNNHHTPLI